MPTESSFRTKWERQDCVAPWPWKNSIQDLGLKQIFVARCRKYLAHYKMEITVLNKFALVQELISSSSSPIPTFPCLTHTQTQIRAYNYSRVFQPAGENYPLFFPFFFLRLLVVAAAAATPAESSKQQKQLNCCNSNQLGLGRPSVLPYLGMTCGWEAGIFFWERERENEREREREKLKTKLEREREREREREKTLR